jgi:predicted secreted hydrolase
MRAVQERLLAARVCTVASLKTHIAVRIVSRAIILFCLFCLSVLMTRAPAIAAPPEFAQVTPGHPLTFPADMGAHPTFKTEWWYATGWLNTPDGQPLGFQITFFRMATRHDAANPSAFVPSQLIIAHAALSDPAFGRVVYDQKTARQGFDLVFAKQGDTNVKLDAWHMTRAADGHYMVSAQAGAFALNLSLTPTQPPLLQGEHGYSQKGPRPDDASYYYSEPQLRVSGSVTRPARAAGGPGGAPGSAAHGNPHDAGAPGGITQVSGMAWLDHEWFSTLLSADVAGWDWLGANLADGSALMAFKVHGHNGGAVWAHAALRDASGRITRFGLGQVDFTPLRTWRSPHTETLYPIAETVKTGSTTWQLEPLLDDQEMDTRDSTGEAYWEGAVTVRRAGQSVGRGYLELTGY